MALNQKTIYVYESFNSDESNLMGRLYVGEGKGSDNFSFEFDEELDTSLLELNQKK